MRAPGPNRTILILLVGLMVFMFAMSFAAVPLYQIFCQKTGFGGTTQVAASTTGEIRDRVITVRFSADVNPDLPWAFEPLQVSQKVRIGEEAIAFYRVTNRSAQPITGMATYNVAPDKAGLFFHKIECFCFIEQTLQPGASVTFPLVYFIDTALDDDPGLKDVRTITLSYTFFPYHDQTTLEKLIKLSPAGRVIS